MEKFSGNVYLSDLPRQSIRGQSVYVELADYTDAHPTFGIYASDANMSTVNVFTTNKDVDFSQAAAAILLPDEAIDRGQELQGNFAVIFFRKIWIIHVGLYLFQTFCRGVILDICTSY